MRRLKQLIAKLLAATGIKLASPVRPAPPSDAGPH